jgi:plastocyanin
VNGSIPDGWRVRAVRAAAAVAVAGAALVIAACGGDGSADGGSASSGEPTTSTAPAGASVPESDYVDLTGSTSVQIDALDNKFKPQYATVKVGTAVTFRNDGRSVHNVLPVTEGAFPPIEADDFQPDDEATITVDEPGLVPYYCSLHGTTTKGMVGGLRVVE